MLEFPQNKKCYVYNIYFIVLTYSNKNVNGKYTHIKYIFMGELVVLASDRS